MIEVSSNIPETCCVPRVPGKGVMSRTFYVWGSCVTPVLGLHPESSSVPLVRYLGVSRSDRVTAPNSLVPEVTKKKAPRGGGLLVLPISL